jgi:ribonuclease Z
MALSFRVLGEAGRDNAVFVSIDSGQKVDRLLFDCGDGCLDLLAVAEVQAIDHVFFSHFHMDHISGFDSFFRLTYDRTVKNNIIWGPPGAGQVMQHRFRGFLWNLYQHLTSKWYVHDIYPDHIAATHFNANEAFAEAHAIDVKMVNAVILDTLEYSVEAYTMNHQTPSIAYIVREKPRTNVNIAQLAAMGLQSGRWLQQVKDTRIVAETVVEISGKSYTLAELREQLLTETPGQSLAYLTDFKMDTDAQSRLVPVLQGCTFMICESQYRAADGELAERNYHMTCVQAAETAKQANVQELILFHVSDRYEKPEWHELLNEACAIFPNTHFPEGWSL